VRDPDEDDTRQRLRAHAEALCRTIGERTVARGLHAAEAYLHEQLAAPGLPVERQAYTAFGTEVANLVASAGPAGDTPLVVGAHYDTVPGTEGADDNASAVCVLLELARRLSLDPPPEPVRLAAFTLEEAPAFGTARQGSRAFLARCRGAGMVPRAGIVLEMVGFTAGAQQYPAALRWAGYPARGDFIGLVSNRRSRRLLRGLAARMREHPRLPVETLTVAFDGRVLPATRLSDHSAFWDARLPAVMVTDTAFFRNPHYHRPSDRLETLDFDFMTAVAQALDHAVRRL
jgi:hypothetical protein